MNGLPVASMWYAKVAKANQSERRVEGFSQGPHAHDLSDLEPDLLAGRGSVSTISLLHRAQTPETRQVPIDRAASESPPLWRGSALSSVWLLAGPLARCVGSRPFHYQGQRREVWEEEQWLGA